MNSNRVELAPDAHLLMASLRSVGYKTETAISDILDNCIAAHATEVHVDFSWNKEDSTIAIYDNGDGMEKCSLIASMKIGSADPSEKRNSASLLMHFLIMIRNKHRKYINKLPRSILYT